MAGQFNLGHNGVVIVDDVEPAAIFTLKPAPRSAEQHCRLIVVNSASAVIKALVENESDHEDLTTLQNIFELPEKISSLLDSNEANEANDVAKWMYHQDTRIHSAPVLAQYYITSIRNHNFVKAVEVASELKSVLQNVESSAKNIERYASRLDDENKHFLALLFYFLAVHYCDDESDVNILINVLVRSCGGTASIMRKVTENNQISEQVISRHVIPLLRKAKIGIAGRLMVNKEKVSHALATALYCIEQCEDCIENHDGRITALREAISVLEDNLRGNAAQHKLYGICWNNLGHAYLMKRRHNEAVGCFEKAIVAKRRAQDYSSKAEQTEDVKKSERGLGVARSGNCITQ